MGLESEAAIEIFFHANVYAVISYHLICTWD